MVAGVLEGGFDELLAVQDCFAVDGLRFFDAGQVDIVVPEEATFDVVHEGIPRPVEACFTIDLGVARGRCQDASF